MTMDIVKQIAPVYEQYVLDWSHKRYLLIGGYGSGKTYHTAYKLILKLYEEDRRAIVAVPDAESLEVIYNVFIEMLDSMGVLGTKAKYEKNFNMVQALNEPWRAKPMRIKFHNGSKIMFRSLDQSYPGDFFYDVSILWVDDAHNADKRQLNDLISRIRIGGPTKQFIYTANALGKDNWIYHEYFRQIDSDDYEHVIVDENQLYKDKVIINNGTYYLHTTASDNKWISFQYLKSLNRLRYDGRLFNMGRWGKFVTADTRVFPHLEVVRMVATFNDSVYQLGEDGKVFYGIDDTFSFIIGCAIDVRLSTIMVFNITPLDGCRDCLDTLDIIKRDNILLMVKDSPTASELKAQDYNVVVAPKDCLLKGIRKLQQFKKVQVYPPLDMIYKELKGMSYMNDTYGYASYNRFNTTPSYLTAICNILSAVEVPSIKESNKNE